MKTYQDYGIEISGSTSRAEVHTTCPKCSASRRNKRAKCLSVNVDKEVWICHHCDWRGSLKGGEESKSNPYAYIKKPFIKPQIREGSLPENVLTWFAERVIPEDVLIRNKITYNDVYMPQVEGRVTCIQFPFYRGEELVNIKSRDGRKNFRLESGAERIFYGLNDIEETTIIVEGEIDKLSLEVAGFKNCVSVPDGAPSPNTKDYSTKFEFLENCKEQIAGVKKFIVAVDSDAPGFKLEEEITRRLGRGRCWWVKWPEGYKDANEVLVNLGATALRECIENARPCPIEGVHEVSSIRDKVINLHRYGFQKGIATGWRNLDEFYTVRPGELTLVTGIPNHGKSDFLDCLMINLAKLESWSFGVFSAEKIPIEYHFAALAEKYTRKPFNVNYYNRMTEEELNAAIEWGQSYFYFIMPSETPSVDTILSLASDLVFRAGIRGLVIDPWNEIEHNRPGNLTETDYISLCLSKVRRFARNNSVHVWLVAHPAKMKKDKNGDYPIPTPYDIAGSAHFNNKADNCITFFRRTDVTPNTNEAHVQKVRFKEVGKRGMAEFVYDVPTGVYNDKPTSFLGF